MKKALLIIGTAFAMMAASCGHQSSAEIDTDLIHNPITANGSSFDSTAVAILVFDSEMHDFGKLTSGENVSYSFHFTNKGNADLLINKCDASCGCTVASFPKNRIAPGQDGYLSVTFKTAGKHGEQYQEVTVLSNAQPGRVKLKIRAYVQ